MLNDVYVDIVRHVLNQCGREGLSVDTTAQAVCDALGLGPDPLTSEEN